MVPRRRRGRGDDCDGEKAHKEAQFSFGLVRDQLLFIPLFVLAFLEFNTGGKMSSGKSKIRGVSALLYLLFFHFFFFFPDFFFHFSPSSFSFPRLFLLFLGCALATKRKEIVPSFGLGSYLAT